MDPSREHLRDLAALLALPRMWRGHKPAFIAASLLDVLVTLLRLDAACIRLSSPQEADVIDDCRPADGVLADALRGVADAALDADSNTAPAVGPLRAFRVSPQLDGERADVMVGSARANFPTQLETFLCRIAVEQALLAVHSSRLVSNLQDANAAKATFLATMSHELRTPLNAVIGYSELLNSEIGGTLTSPQQHHVARIETAARHLIGLIEGILTFARIEAGKETVQASDVHVRQLTESVAALLEPLARQKGLALSMALPDAPLSMHTDEAKLRQVLLNLLSNAVKFTSAGFVRVSVMSAGSDVIWRVEDSGIGIAEGDLKVIFEPFRQVGRVLAVRPAGTGLGLSVSRELARMLGGEVTVTSQLGNGSTFELRVPQTLPRS